MTDVLTNRLGEFTHEQAADNMDALTMESYPGRVVAVGLNESEQELHLVTAIMGRSTPSQTRTYEREGMYDVRSVPFGEDVDPLTAYLTMTRMGGVHIASNGDQTDTLVAALARADLTEADDDLSRAEAALLTRNHEPDSSNTPRISVVVKAKPRFPALFSIIRNNPEDPGNEDSSAYRFYSGRLLDVLEPGTGLYITTYEENASPLPAFEGGPRPVLIGDTAAETARWFAETLDYEGGFLVAVAARAIAVTNGETSEPVILNKYQAPGGPEPNYP